MRSWFQSSWDACQTLGGTQYLPLSSGRLQLRSKRFSSRSSSNGGISGYWRWRGSAPSNALCAGMVLLPWLTVLVLTAVIWRARPHGGLPPVVNELPGGKQCIGWKQTYFCHPFAERYAQGDRGCDDVIYPGVSGYCVCESNVTTARVTCGPMQPFTCKQKCMQLAINPGDALELPTLATCPYERPYELQQYLAGLAAAPDSWQVDVAAERVNAAKPWQQVMDSIHRHGLGSVVPPGVRNETHDFVLEGGRMRADDVQYVAARVAAFKADIPAYPAGVFSGRGVVMVGGGLRYMTSAWVSVHMLRRSGCSLPIEMWYPVAEAPSAEAAAAFAQLGVSTRLLDMPGFNISKPFSKEADVTDHNMGRFTIKAAVLLLTRFEEVLYLDADNFALRDPTPLFDSEEFKNTTAIFWQDYWSNTLALETPELLGVPREVMPSGSFESGQMVLNKRQHWKGLVMAMYINSYSSFWYEMFTCYLGKGDKETFAYALMSMGEPYTLVHTAPRAIGTTGTSEYCNRRTHVCQDQFTGNTMGQADLNGKLLFMHSNMHKWDLRLPEKFSLHYQRRWTKMLPDDVDFVQWQEQQLGFDAERLVYDLVRQLKCMPWWDAYYQDRVLKGDRKTPELDGFHYLLRGIDLYRMYNHGWDGNYEATIEVLHQPGWRERWGHAYRGGLRWSLVGWHLLPHVQPGA